MSRWSFSLFGSDGSKLVISTGNRAALITAMIVERERSPAGVWNGFLPPPPEHWHGTLAGPGILQTTAKPTRDEVFAALLPTEEGSYV